GSGQVPAILKLGEDAGAVFCGWAQGWETGVLGPKHPPVLVSHVSKYRSLMPSLAGLFELADLVAAGRDLSERLVISLEHARQAAAFCEYLESHAKRVYSCTLLPERSAAIALFERLKKNALPETFTTRDVYLKGWSGLDTPDDARGALRVLERHLWIERVSTQPTTAGGRPTESWVCNPRMLRDAK